MISFAITMNPKHPLSKNTIKWTHLGSLGHQFVSPFLILSMIILTLEFRIQTVILKQW